MTENRRIRPRAFSFDEGDKRRRQTNIAANELSGTIQDDLSLLEKRRIQSSCGSNDYPFKELLSARGHGEFEVAPINSIPASFGGTSEAFDSPHRPCHELEPLSSRTKGIFRHRRALVGKNMQLPSLKSTSTGFSSSDGEDNKVKVRPSLSPRRARLLHREMATPTQRQSGTTAGTVWKNFSFSFFMYLSAFSIFGSILRVFLARFFGEDCERHSVNDFLTPISTQVCVTASGRTLQTGGALFIDLPANMIGSFVMGLITPPPDTDHKLRMPWFRKDNPIQRDDVLHTAFTVGFCGSLTTFASWNSQMVVMMEGTHTELGSQVVSALFGYVLGMMAAIECFKGGRRLSSWLQNWRNPPDVVVCSSDDSSDVEEGIPIEGKSSVIASRTNGVTNSPNSLFSHLASALKPKRSIFLFVTFMLTSFVVGDVVSGIRFYRKLTLICLMSPAGAMLRWILSHFNSPGNTCVGRGRFDWIPSGTILANVVGSVVSIVFVALGDHLVYNDRSPDEWTPLIFSAVTTGFAGSLSTVSSMVKEVVLLSENYPGTAKHYQYAGGTIVVSMLLSLCLNVTLVRIL